MIGTNDVNGENRGIVVNEPGIGSVKIGWADFDQVTFEPAPETGPSYADYGSGHELFGTVQSDEGTFRGRIIYDLDEAWDFELLQGKNHDTEYSIPFRDILRIEPRGGRGASVVLREGLTIELEDSHDVSRANDGVLIFEGAGKPKYIDWRALKSIEFRDRETRGVDVR